MTSEADKKAWKAFFNLAKDFGLKSRDEFAKSVTGSAEAKQGMRLLNAWMAKVKKRVDTVKIIKKIMEEHNSAVWQVFQRREKTPRQTTATTFPGLPEYKRVNTPKWRATLPMD